MNALKVALYILVYPGFLFQSGFSTFLEWLDRKVYARMQNRRGPMYTGWAGILQPIADIVKLLSKEDIVPAAADQRAFAFMPILSLAAVFTAGLYLPVWHLRSFNSFEGDLIVVLYLLTIPSFALFLAGWFSVSPYSLLGATRVLTQLFAYEVPFFMAVLTPAVLAGSWQISKIAIFPWTVAGHWWVIPIELIAFVVAILALQAKLERVPFDIPEAETEIVAGSFTEYSGRLLAMFRLAISVEMIVGATLIGAVFLPFGLDFGPPIGFAFYLAKTLAIVAGLTVFRTVFARLRIDQMIDFCWKYVAPVAFVQLLVDLVVKGIVTT